VVIRGIRHFQPAEIIQDRIDGRNQEQGRERGRREAECEFSCVFYSVALPVIPTGMTAPRAFSYSGGNR